MSELTVIERAEKALSLAARKAELSELVKQSERITSITNKAGRDECHAAAMRLKTERVAIQKTGKEARDDANAFAKAVIAVEKELVGILDPEESRLFDLRDEWDAKIEAEKQKKIAEEKARAEALQKRVAIIRAIPSECAGLKSSEVADRLRDLQLQQIGPEFEEFREQAQEAKDQACARLSELVEVFASREKEESERAEAARIEAEKLAAERAELERLRAEQAERDRVAREALEREQAEARQARAEAEARERAAREAEEKAIAEQRAAEQARLEAEQRAAREAAARAEQARLEAEKAKQAHEIATATLETAAREALDLLEQSGLKEHVTTRKLAAALGREQMRDAA